MVLQPTVAEELLRDERWQLVQRIVSSAPFHKSNRLRELLQYVTERTIHGYSHELTEQQIGEALFRKPIGYSPLEDSSVRVHVRQLRLKLHEYFDEDGRNEPLTLEIPKGSYAPVFRPAEQRSPAGAEVVRLPLTRRAWHRHPAIPWLLCLVLAISCGVLAYRRRSAVTAGGVAAADLPWPFSQIFDKQHQTMMVVADGNYGMWRILTREPGSLDSYLSRVFAQAPEMNNLGGAGSPFGEYVANSTLTSFADLADVVSLLEMAGPLNTQVVVRYPRDLRMRDLEHENLIFIGSPASNPWVSLFQDRLNFRESEGAVGRSPKAFVNLHPQPGEKTRYEGLRWTGTAGEDYATVALLPNPTHDGSVLILQGLQQEGSEAAGRFLSDAENRRQLQRALGLDASRRLSGPIWFEALIRSRTVSGAPGSPELVTVRRLHE